MSAIGSIYAKQKQREDALEELVVLADEVGPIARRLEGEHRDGVSAFVLGRLEGRLRIIASALGAKSVEPRRSRVELDDHLLEVVDEADRFLAGIEDNALAGDAGPIREKLKRLMEAFGLEGER